VADKPIINIVSTRCQPDDDTKFNKWYNEVHIPMLFKAKEMKSVARYKVVGEAHGQPTYVAIYKFNSLSDYEKFGKGPEMAAARKEMNESWGQRIEIASRVQYELIKEWEK
jgi:hypothetical protein